MRKILSLLSVFMLVSMLVFSQTRPITGRVVDDAGQPISGASVSIKGSTVGTSADVNGAFRINAKTGDVLIVSAVGAPAKEITVTSNTNLTISLARQSLSLSEVVVTSAFNIKRTKRSTTNNAQVVGGEQLNTIRQTNINNALA
ncbi:MAG: SusC/RagA family TonB-linked outer membrane protein, partial [Segetibacter sp.]|nr:SusC/RagA family TonB-linked outer membrane protein [Segetibacter sp.]